MSDKQEVRDSRNLFFSYGHDANAEIVNELRRSLQQEGYSVWIDTAEI